MQVTDEEVMKEMRKLGVPEQYLSEGLDIIRNYMQRKDSCTLEEAVAFLVRWIKRLE